MAGEVRQKIDGGTAQNVANCLWAFATLGELQGGEGRGAGAGRGALMQGGVGPPWLWAASRRWGECLGGQAGSGGTGGGQCWVRNAGACVQTDLLFSAVHPHTLPPHMGAVPSPTGFHPGDEVMAALAAAIKQKLPECTSQVGWVGAHLFHSRSRSSGGGGGGGASAPAAAGTAAGASSGGSSSRTETDTSGGTVHPPAPRDPPAFPLPPTPGPLAPILPQNISNAILAFAKLEWAPGAAVLEGLAAEALAKIRTFSPQAWFGYFWAQGAHMYDVERMYCAAPLFETPCTATLPNAGPAGVWRARPSHVCATLCVTVPPPPSRHPARPSPTRCGA